MPRSRCIILLSEKSSGSSAFQRLLARHADIRHLAKTRHVHFETLYWTKAASILELPQVDMVDSEVPMPRERAKADLDSLLRDNLEAYSPSSDDREMIFDGWRRLCESHAPVFLEKSPHHLCQWSALELIIESMSRLPTIDTMLVGLIRNPMDTLYSQFRRWKARPEERELRWQIAYRNLQRLAQSVGDKLVTLRYEDVVADVNQLKPIYDFCGVKVDATPAPLHDQSLQKWKRDAAFGFQLSSTSIELARDWGYDESELFNQGSRFWPIIREVSRFKYRLGWRVKSIVKRIRGTSQL